MTDILSKSAGMADTNFDFIDETVIVTGKILPTDCGYQRYRHPVRTSTLASPSPVSGRPGPGS